MITRCWWVRPIGAAANAISASSTQLLLGGTAFKPDRETDYFEKILHKVKFKKWFFGHYHNNRNVSDREILLYEQIIRIL